MRAVVCVTMALLCGASQPEQSTCTAAFEKISEAKAALQREKPASKGEYAKILKKAFEVVLELADECLADAEDVQHHNTARYEKAMIYARKGDVDEMHVIFDSFPFDQRDVHYYFQKGTLLKDLELLEDSYTTFAHGALLLKTDSNPSATWEEWRHHVARLPLGTDMAEQVLMHPSAALLLQELVDQARQTRDATGYIEALSMAIQVSPYNRQLRNFIATSLSGGVVDLRTMWRAYAMPPGVPYTLAQLQDSVGAFSAELPRFASTLARHAIADEAWGEACLQHLGEVCETPITSGDVVVAADLHAVLAQCLKAQGIVADWEAAAASVGTTLGDILSKTGEQLRSCENSSFAHPASISHTLSRLGSAVLGVAPLDLRVAGEHGLAPAHTLNAICTAEEGVLGPHADLEDTWGRALHPPCWAQGCEAKVEGFAESVAKAVAAYDPDLEWGRLSPNGDPEAEEDFKKWVRWEGRAEGFPKVFAERLGSDPLMQVDYVSLSDPDVFLRDYVAVGRPAVLHGALADDVLKQQQGIFDFAPLARALAQTPLPFSASPHTDDTVLPKKPGRATLFGFAYEEVRTYGTALINGPMLGPFKEVAAVPPAAAPLFLKNETRFWLRAGGSGSGKSMSFEAGHVVDQLLRGRRVWLLLPPQHAEYINGTALEVFQRCLADGLPVLEAQQLEGDAVYVPPGWSSLFVNLRGSVAWSALFSHGGAYVLQSDPPPIVPPQAAHTAQGSVTVGSEGGEEEL